MSVPKGKDEYTISGGNVVAFGISHSREEMQHTVCTDVFDKL